MGIKLPRFDSALIELNQISTLIRSIDGDHQGIRVFFERAVAYLELFTEFRLRVDVGGRVRTELLFLRQRLGYEYDNLPAPDKLIRHCDNALEAVPGAGKPSQAPYA